MKQPHFRLAARVALIAAFAFTAMSFAADTPDETVIDFSKVDRKPVVTFQARPRYPKELKDKKEAGQALIDFVVDAHGVVRSVRVVRATNPAFGEAAAEAVQKWKFKPGAKDGRDVATHMQVPIVFGSNEKSK